MSCTCDCSTSGTESSVDWYRCGGRPNWQGFSALAVWGAGILSLEIMAFLRLHHLHQTTLTFHHVPSEGHTYLYTSPYRLQMKTAAACSSILAA